MARRAPELLLPPLLAPLAVLLALPLGGRIALPALATAAVYPFMARLVLRGRPGRAAAATLLWAASLSASLIAVSARHPETVGAVVLRGPEYRAEMFAFVRQGTGRESDPRRFLPEHALHLCAFAALAMASGGLFGILMGSILISYMSYYVGSLAAAGGAPWTACLLGWPPYAILRVAAYVLLGVALSRPLLAALARRPLPLPGARLWYLGSLVLLIADVVLKWLLAPLWAAILRPCLAGYVP